MHNPGSIEMGKSELRTEPLSDVYKNDYIATLVQEIQTNENLSKEEILEKTELVLIERTNTSAGENNFKPKKNFYENRFILGQFYFESKKYRKAFDVFDSIKNNYILAMYQMGVILYDDLLDKDQSLDQNLVNNDGEEEFKEIDFKTGLTHPNRHMWTEGFQYMLKISNSPENERYKKLIHQAQYNVGKAYFQGFGVKQSDDEAENWWTRACDNGSPIGCVSAMTALAFFYSRKLDPEYFDLKKAFLWHNEACGSGSLESQGALGAMYYFGIGTKQDMQAAHECLSNSSERGNVYSMGLLCDYYYRRKFFIKAYELSKKVSSLNEVDRIAKETGCVKTFVHKGISMASFTIARCLDLGKGIAKDPELAKKYYRRSYYFDPDLCQLYQNHVSHQKI